MVKVPTSQHLYNYVLGPCIVSVACSDGKLDGGLG